MHATQVTGTFCEVILEKKTYIMFRFRTRFSSASCASSCLPLCAMHHTRSIEYLFIFRGAFLRFTGGKNVVNCRAKRRTKG